MRQQVGALPVRWIGAEPRVLLVTSRESQRWIIPKGWRMRGRSDAEAAAQEAFEEAGVRGRIRRKPIGRYLYDKRRADGVEECRITAYLLEVTEELEAFPEMEERRRAWFTLEEAAACADDEGLREILRALPQQLATLGDRKAARKRAKGGTDGGKKKAAPPPEAAESVAAIPARLAAKRRARKAAAGKAAGNTSAGKPSTAETSPETAAAGKAAAGKAKPGKKARSPRGGPPSPGAAVSEAAE